MSYFNVWWSQGGAASVFANRRCFLFLSFIKEKPNNSAPKNK